MRPPLLDFSVHVPWLCFGAVVESGVWLLDAHQRAESLVLRALVAEHLPGGAPSIKSLLEHLDTTDFDAD